MKKVNYYALSLKMFLWLLSLALTQSIFPISDYLLIIVAVIGLAVLEDKAVTTSLK
ncbi:hypothetical protein [Alteromonas sp. BZK5]|uniref:hypothetical protein n=1 Tax=Alteromonas sp. BZK5 TaxID=1904459 RepID=UPI001653845B|nr:hypothetical protein [Alteromonas sp. BZK5]MBC6987397.1 hypothetical protein [Alteromonas sp. BZK5]|tara:strand:- start:73 stop:240 length:168 start_codon:yes stop_codon:yes gene_type:complete